MTARVLILSHPADRHVAAVVPHLVRCGVEPVHLDTAALGTPAAPVIASISSQGRIAGRVGAVPLEAVTCVWHRRPSVFAAADPVDAAELRAGVGGILATLPYLNHPADMAVAALKPYQLATAGRAGLQVPRTVVATSRQPAAALERALGEVLVKPMSPQVASLVTETDRSGWDRAAHLTQQRIVADHHVRLTVVDGEMYAARIDTAYLDWRTETGPTDTGPADGTRDARAAPTIAVTATPVRVARAVRVLLARLHLRYAALDFAVDAEGTWWFLEANPNGQWLWIEQSTGLPIAEAIAAALAALPPLGAARA